MNDAPIYLDHHATTPCEPEVLAAMLPYFSERFGNAASRFHGHGKEAKNAVEAARLEVAEFIGANPREIIFTSGATESLNLALQGLARAAGRKVHLVSTPIEHPAVLDTLKALEHEGHRVTLVGVSELGIVRPTDIEAAIGPDTIAVCVMAANNEIGTLQPMAAIGEICRSKGVALVSDTTQFAGWLPLNMAENTIDLACLSAHKMYGPKGIGCLYVRRKRPALLLEELIHGGGHERGLRSGTLNVPAIVGFGVAVGLRKERMSEDTDRVAALRDELLSALRSSLTGLEVNGSLEHRLPNNLNVSLAGVEARALMEHLPGLAISTGSACSTAELEPSHVIRALGFGDGRALSALRFGLGRTTTPQEIGTATKSIVTAVGGTRR